MAHLSLPTEEDHTRARSDPAFRQKMLSDHLELLLNELKRLRRNKPDAARAQQIRDGVDMAVKISALLQK